MNDKVNKTGKRNAGVDGIGVALAIILGWVLHQFAGIDMPDEVQMAIGGVILIIAHRVDTFLQIRSEG